MVSAAASLREIALVLQTEILSSALTSYGVTASSVL